MKFQPGNKAGRQFSADNQPENRGRKPKLSSIPREAQEEIIAALYHALSLPDVATAKEYLQRTADRLPKYGHLIQVYIKGMTGPNALQYVADILDRIIGKPRQSQEITIGTNKGGGDIPGIRIVETRIVHPRPSSIQDQADHEQ